MTESNLTTPIKIKNTYTFKPSNPSPRSLFSQKKKKTQIKDSGTRVFMAALFLMMKTGNNADTH